MNTALSGLTAEALITGPLTQRIAERTELAQTVAAKVSIAVRNEGIWELDFRVPGAVFAPASGDATCAIVVGLAALEAVLAGQATAHTLFMRGLIKVQGDHRAALRLGALFA